MNITDINPSTAMLMYAWSSQTNKLPPDNQSPPNKEKQEAAVSVIGSTKQNHPIAPPKTRLQPLKKATPPNTEPVNLKAGVVKTFVHEVDLVKKQILTPRMDNDEQPSVDSLA